MKKFSDWLEYYNNLDVIPFLEALEKMRDFYTQYEIDIFKDALSLPGVSMKYVIRTSESELLYAPNLEDYQMLKDSVTGGPSIVFTRYHEAGVT